MLHGSFEMNNGNNRGEDSWDPFKDVGEAKQGLDCRNITLEVNESAIVLYIMEMQL